MAPEVSIADILEKTRGTLIRRAPLTETSLIVHWCTRDRGLIKTVAKGARRPKSPFAGKLDLFFEAEIGFVGSRASDLHTLREVAVERHREGIRRHFRRLSTAAYFVQLIELVSERETPIPALHDLLAVALDYLDETDPPPLAVVRFERRLAELLGLHPGRSAGSAAAVLGQLHHRLPEGRAELLRALAAIPSPDASPPPEGSGARDDSAPA